MRQRRFCRCFLRIFRRIRRERGHERLYRHCCKAPRYKRLSQSHRKAEALLGQCRRGACISSDKDIEADSDSAETRSILLSKINELGEPDSTIILQKYYYERSSAEIAEILSMKSSAVRMRAARALEKLRKKLANVGITL